MTYLNKTAQTLCKQSLRPLLHHIFVVLTLFSLQYTKLGEIMLKKKAEKDIVVVTCLVILFKIIFVPKLKKTCNNPKYLKITI